jgi:hypothetical protein
MKSRGSFMKLQAALTGCLYQLKRRRCGVGSAEFRCQVCGHIINVTLGELAYYTFNGELYNGSCGHSNTMTVTELTQVTLSAIENIQEQLTRLETINVHTQPAI